MSMTTDEKREQLKAWYRDELAFDLTEDDVNENLRDRQLPELTAPETIEDAIGRLVNSYTEEEVQDLYDYEKDLHKEEPAGYHDQCGPECNHGEKR